MKCASFLGFLLCGMVVLCAASCNGGKAGASASPDAGTGQENPGFVDGTDGDSEEDISFDIQPAVYDAAGTYHDTEGGFVLRNASPYALYAFPGSEEYDDAVSTVLMTDNDRGTVGEIIVRDLSVAQSLALGDTGFTLAGVPASKERNVSRDWNGETLGVLVYNFESPKTGKIYRVYLMPDLEAWFDQSFGFGQ